MINTHYLELPLSRQSFPVSKGVRAIEARLYKTLQQAKQITASTRYFTES